MTGIDISQKQLDRNKDLQETILGDIQTYPLPSGAFDVVVCWDVLEHLQHPESAVRNLAAAIREEGLLILAFPDPRSLKGLITRLTPHRFHVWSYRHLRRSKRAGTEDYGPFPTVMSPEMAPDRVIRLGRELGLTTELDLAFSATRLSRRRALPVQICEVVLEGVAILLRVVTWGRYRGELSERRLVFRRED